MSKRPTVFLPHVPTRFDPLTESHVPIVNLQPAVDFGELSMLTKTPTAAEPQNINKSIAAIQEGLKLMRPTDYIAMIGEPLLCGAAVAFACSLFGTVQVLRWDRASKMYQLLKIKM